MLETTNLPEIEIQGHRQRLRAALLNSKYYNKGLDRRFGTLVG